METSEIKPTDVVADIMRRHRGCVGAIMFIHECQAAGLDRAEINQVFKTCRLRTAVAAGIRYVYRPGFAMSAYKDYLEGRSWNSYYRQKDLERLT